MAPPSILVLGLGELGHEVVKSLAHHPKRGTTTLSVLLRSQNPTHLQLLRAWNITPVFADVVQDSPATLAKLFSNYHTVLCCVGMYAPPETQPKIARAALEGGVQRYFPWQYGIDYDVVGRNSSQNLFDSQLDVRELLRGQSAMKWVIVSTGMFISFLFEPAFGLVGEGRDVVMGIGGWGNEITVTAPVDIGRVTAEIALGHEGVEGVVFVSGDTVSMGRLADVVEGVMGRKVERVLKTVPELKKELEEAPEDSMRKYRVVFAEGKGVAWSKAESFNEVQGITTQTVEEWARENLKKQ
ncbi:hypothetical protein M409DRAFT_19737 [Zasmidium cellare ATCC 36951]|uniref:NmrA-like domain-containing protein n=1 Tax=Zasmidium cellare ATCC 36951 TaxID=1080233 RepID=A0A6A6CWD6_ZASCE|nr:uncharacterized protein M409DRAFT_19737 [Zasmidium cellare ATCC 36951]KAF2170132.1 hypothetical protein M409DRAFT_19737 [Zasmidium cellare ATCC 36951]